MPSRQTRGNLRACQGENGSDLRLSPDTNVRFFDIWSPPMVAERS
jgi:hypothetical protein